MYIFYILYVYTLKWNTEQMSITYSFTLLGLHFDVLYFLAECSCWPSAGSFASIDDLLSRYDTNAKRQTRQHTPNWRRFPSNSGLPLVTSLCAFFYISSPRWITIPRHRRWPNMKKREIGNFMCVFVWMSSLKTLWVLLFCVPFK